MSFTGGEPTLHPRFPDILKAAKMIGYRTSVTTAGSMLARHAYAAKVLPFLDSVAISTHGDTAELHDSLVGSPGSFDLIVRAFKNVAAMRPTPYLMTITVLMRANIDRILSIVKFLANVEGVRQCAINNVGPEGDASWNYGQLACRLTDISAAIKPLVEMSRRTGILLQFSNIPLCILRDDLGQPDNFQWVPRVTVERGVVDARMGLHETPKALTPTGRARFYAPKCSSVSCVVTPAAASIRNITIASVMKNCGL